MIEINSNQLQMELESKKREIIQISAELQAEKAKKATVSSKERVQLLPACIDTHEESLKYNYSTLKIIYLPNNGLSLKQMTTRAKKTKGFYENTDI